VNVKLGRGWYEVTMVLLKVPIQQTEQLHEKLITAGNPANNETTKRINLQTIPQHQD
jgi:hypothetical protein